MMFSGVCFEILYDLDKRGGVLGENGWLICGVRVKL